ncbi:MAG: UDP-N-acetylmuramate--L-alanine ligase [Parcubacteria group bacterium CG22_combo_CG10-13_8_21_14_all_41_9]|nr:MAG: UDP-N-acetylmuramate--L-alanine ligase [Parcubacteria group bacterium CG22_combo_CG10-13_8_21_14_all_41_9]
MNLNNYKHIYLIGIGGISMSAIAKLFLHHKIKVSGFDLVESDITREIMKLGAEVVIADKNAKLPQGVDLLVFSEAVPENDALRIQAQDRGIKQLSGSQFWGEFSKDKKVIAISGTNGKSTTTTMIGLMLEEAGFDPTVVVGTRVLQWDSNIRIGKSEWLVIEADEYKAKMLNYTPYIAVITNIAEDHLDFYKDLDDIIAHFQKWIDKVPDNGFIVLNRDDKNSQTLSANQNKLRKFGIKGNTNTRAIGMTTCSGVDSWTGSNDFNIVDDKQDWGLVKMNVPGMFNAQNAIASALAADLAGAKRKKIIKALEKFKGTWRRFEMVGEINSALIVSDYAHHPAGIRATLEAARGWYPFHRILVLFQPHHHNRTKKLFNDFVGAFEKADEVIISEIYDVAGREQSDDQSVSSKDLVEAILSRHPLGILGAGSERSEASRGLSADHVFYALNLASAEQLLKQKIKPEDVVIIMGAGDVDKVARNIVKT